MEVHPPHESVHSWRDALIHIGLMTVGLFIALMLEGLVEYVHHKHLVREARENIRRELENNQRAAHNNVQSLKTNAAKVEAGLKTLRYMRTHPEAQNQSIEFNLSMQDLSDAAYRTARDTGAFGYMSYDEVQRYAGVYGAQQDLNRSAVEVLRHEAETLAPVIASEKDFRGVPPAQFDDMLRSTGVNLMDVQLLVQFTQNLEQEYADVLKQ